MTAQATRDALAEMDGYKRKPAFRDDVTGVVLPERWYKNGRSHPDGHPHAPTLDGANAAVPEGWTWGRGLGLPVVGASKMRWVAWRWTPYQDVEVPDTGNPMADLYALALACRHAMEERK